MKLIKEFLFGRRANPICDLNPSCHTLTPDKRLPFHQWVKEFNVSMLYDRKIVEMN
jgi:hypothetical protein